MTYREEMPISGAEQYLDFRTDYPEWYADWEYRLYLALQHKYTD